MNENDNSLHSSDVMDVAATDRLAATVLAFELRASSTALYDRARRFDEDLSMKPVHIDIAMARMGFIGPRMIARAYPTVLRRIASRKTKESLRILHQLDINEPIDY